MVIVMRPDATENQLARVLEQVDAMGFRTHLSPGSERTIVGIIGDDRPMDLEAFNAFDGVERTVRILHPFKLASRELHPQDHTIALSNGALLGGDQDVLMMAGPCSVESREQLHAVAESLAELGVRVLRGGAFKPRTSPYSFQGLGEKGLVILREIADEFQMAVVTEVVASEDVELVVQYADMLQVGARNMSNFNLLEAIGDTSTPILLKRGLASTVEELLQAAEYVLARGNGQVAVCERGIRTFETSTRFTLDINAVPILKQLTYLPVVVDPSHATGRADLVTPIARAGVAAGADGLLIEVHPNPPEAKSDGAQSLTPEAFERLVHEVAGIAAAMGRGGA